MTFLKPEQRQRLLKAALSLILVILSVAGSLVADYFTTIGDFEPPLIVEAVTQNDDTGADIPILVALDDLDYGTTHFTALEAEDLTATDDATIGDDLTVTGAATIGETLDVTGNSTLAGTLAVAEATTLDLTIAERTSLTATTTTITPTHTLYSLDSGGAVTITLAASGTNGQLLILIGDDANTITVADTNIRTSDGNALTIGQYDIVMLIYQDSEWHELLKLANQ